MASDSEKFCLNIVFIGESYLGGMAGSKRIQNIINSLLKLDSITIHNLIIGNPNEKDKLEQIGTINSVSYHKIFYNIANPFSLIRHYIKGFKFISKAKNKGAKNIVYCYDSPTILKLPFLLYARLRKMKVVVDVVEDYSLVETINFRGKQKIKLYFYELLERNMHLYCNGILSISNALKKKNKKITKGKIPLMYLPITVNFDFFKEDMNQRNEVIKIFYGGSFGEKDGLIYLLKAFEIIEQYYSNIELILTGKPDKQGMDSILDFINTTKIKSKIHYLGYLEDNLYYKTLQNCDIFCMTRINSKYANAGFPFKLGEMLATGKPVLATKVGDICFFLENGTNAILVEPNSEHEIANGLKLIIENPERAKNIGFNGKKVALDFFDSDKIAISLRSFLTQLK